MNRRVAIVVAVVLLVPIGLVVVDQLLRLASPTYRERQERAREQQVQTQRSRNEARAAELMKRQEQERADEQARDAQRLKSAAETYEAQYRKWQEATVDIGRLISDYQNNELAADRKYKGQAIQVTGGLVRAVKNDVLGKPYVTVASARSDFRAVHCLLRANSLDRAATLQINEPVTVRGTVSGLMIDVLLDDCQVW